VWLAATEHGLAVQPYDLYALLEELETDGRPLAYEVGALLGDGVVLLRLAYLPPPSARSPRRPVSEILTFANQRGSMR
jgi:hypothetical protein